MFKHEDKVIFTNIDPIWGNRPKYGVVYTVNKNTPFSSESSVYLSELNAFYPNSSVKLYDGEFLIGDEVVHQYLSGPVQKVTQLNMDYTKFRTSDAGIWRYVHHYSRAPICPNELIKKAYKLILSSTYGKLDMPSPERSEFGEALVDMQHGAAKVAARYSKPKHKSPVIPVVFKKGDKLINWYTGGKGLEVLSFNEETQRVTFTHCSGSAPASDYILDETPDEPAKFEQPTFIIEIEQKRENDIACSLSKNGVEIAHGRFSRYVDAADFASQQISQFVGIDRVSR